MTPREAALLSLNKCDTQNKYSNLELDASIKKYGLNGADRALYTTLVYGVIERRISLDYYIGTLSSTPIGKIENTVLNVLRLGLYQILYMDRIPESAAVNESVELSKLHCHKGVSGFVNGVLRSAVRKKDTLVPPDPKEAGEAVHLSVKYGIPQWLCGFWSGMYGSEACEKILAATCSHPKITLRVNTLLTDRDTLAAKFEDLGISVSKTKISPVGLTLDEFVPISSITPMDEGLCYVQDESSQICTLALGAMPGETTADVCCCPGGKSFGIAMEMKNEGKLFCFDLHASKLSLVSKGAEKLGISIIETEVHNGSSPRPELIGKLDRVICDAPCSGLGVIAKKPDLRLKTPGDISRLPEIQYNILKASARYLRPGGTLIYSTCTLNRAENQEVTQRFMVEHSDEFIRVPLGVIPGEDDVCERTIMPYEFGSDGFFIAKFRKKI